MKELYLLGYTYKQIGIIMNIKKSKVYTYLSKDKSIKKRQGFATKPIPLP